jgi:3-phenylpropionate/trans-cinnamate dioxygenase ferredoxin reductase subunit
VDRLQIRSPEAYRELNIDWIAGRRAEAIDRARRCVELSTKEAVPFDALIIATGASPRRLAVPGHDLAGVFALRTVKDSLRLRTRLVSGVRLAVIGGGFLGLEVAAAAAQRGASVTVIEAGSRLLQRSGSSVLSEILAARLLQAGVIIIPSTSVTCLEGAGSVETIRTADGRSFPADAVLVAIGAAPETGLMDGDSLSGPTGIVVDAQGRTGLSDIYAIGDCADFHDVRFGCHMRLESVQSATWQARVAAADIAGREPPLPKPAYFWSELFDLKVQIVGFPDPTRLSRCELVGSAAAGWAIYCFQDDRVTAVECINRPTDFVRAQSLVGRRARSFTDLKEYLL